MAERVVEIKGLEKLLNDLDEFGRLDERVWFPVHDAMSQAVQLVEERVKQRTPIGATGALRGSIGSQVEVSETAIEGRVGTNLGLKGGVGGMSGYAQAVEFGTKPHWPPLEPLIYWVKRKRLAGTYSIKTQRRLGSRAIQVKQDVALARAVQAKIARHGTRAQPFFWPAIQESLPDVVRLFEEAAAEIARRFSGGE